MIYIENIFVCIAIPMLLSLFFTEHRQRVFTLFVVAGMAICLLAAYVSSFFMNYYQTNATTTMIEITPVCEEVMKLLPLLFYYLIFEPEKKQVTSAALALSVGFATFENACYLTENGASQFSFLLIRGISAGAVRHPDRLRHGLRLLPPLVAAHRYYRTGRRLHHPARQLQPAHYSGRHLEAHRVCVPVAFDSAFVPCKASADTGNPSI